jgi:hypothetical protein
MEARKHIEAATRFFERIGAKDWAGLAPCISPDVRRVGPWGDAWEGREPYLAFLTATVNAMEQYTLDIKRVFSDGTYTVAQLSETWLVDGKLTRYDQAIVVNVGRDGLVEQVECYLQSPHLVDDTRMAARA